MVWAPPRSLAATRGITVCFLFLQVLRWFSSLSVPSAPYEFRCGWRVVERVGLPHSAIRGSRDVCSSPRLLAAYHGLLRTVAPRHPPWTLSRLTIFSLAPLSRCVPALQIRFPRLGPQANLTAALSRANCRVPISSRRASFHSPSLELSKNTRTVTRTARRALRWSPNHLPGDWITPFDTIRCRGFQRSPGFSSKFAIKIHAVLLNGIQRLWRYGDLNPRPMACKATALATELYPRGHGTP